MAGERTDRHSLEWAVGYASAVLAYGRANGLTRAMFRLSALETLLAVPATPPAPALAARVQALEAALDDLEKRAKHHAGRGIMRSLQNTAAAEVGREFLKAIREHRAALAALGAPARPVAADGRDAELVLRRALGAFPGLFDACKAAYVPLHEAAWMAWRALRDGGYLAAPPAAPSFPKGWLCMDCHFASASLHRALEHERPDHRIYQPARALGCTCAVCEAEFRAALAAPPAAPADAGCTA